MRMPVTRAPNLTTPSNHKTLQGNLLDTFNADAAWQLTMGGSLGYVNVAVRVFSGSVAPDPVTDLEMIILRA